MITFYLIFTAFAVTTVAKGPLECSFEDSAGIHQCHGVEGQHLIFNLSKSTNTTIMLKKDGTIRILKIDRYGTAKLDDKYVSQFEQIQTGQFKLGKATKKHSGEYQLEEHSFTDGKMIKNVTVRLNIHTPVSKPAVSQSCFSLESSTVNCSSGGDEVEFLLTLNGHLLMQTKDHSQLLSVSTDDIPNVSTVSMNIHGQLTGNLLCQVVNKVSRNETSFHLRACTGFKTLTVPLLAGTATLFLFVALGLIVSKLLKKTRPPPDTEDNCEEVIYTNVKVTKNK